MSLLNETTSPVRRDPAGSTSRNLRRDVVAEAIDYPEDLYRFDVTETPLASPGAITEADVDRFRRDGYLAVDGLFPATRVADVLAGLAAVLASPGSAVVEYEAWARPVLAEHPDATGDERMDLVRKLMRFTKEDERLRDAAQDPGLLQIVRRLAAAVDHRAPAPAAPDTPDGPTMELYQDMALLKPPGGGREKPWHQDNAYFHLEPGTPIIGVWIALDPATAENGCMHVKPGTHGAPVLHFQRRDLQVCDTDVDRSNDVTVPLSPGGALFFHGLLVHGTPANRTATRRRAVQFHYIPVATPTTDDERHTSLFGGDALGASC